MWCPPKRPRLPTAVKNASTWPTTTSTPPCSLRTISIRRMPAAWKAESSSSAASKRSPVRPLLWRPSNPAPWSPVRQLLVPLTVPAKQHPPIAPKFLLADYLPVMELLVFISYCCCQNAINYTFIHCIRRFFLLILLFINFNFFKLTFLLQTLKSRLTYVNYHFRSSRSTQWHKRFSINVKRNF